jgi:hypothetical protein
LERVIDANSGFVGSEPKIVGDISKLDLMITLSWYAQNKDIKDALKYSSDYFKKSLKLDASSVLKDKSTTFGFVCRMLSNGGVLTDKYKKWFDDEVEKIKLELKSPAKKQDVTDKQKINVVNIQDRIREKAYECIGELEGQFDELIISSFKTTVSPYSLFQTMNIKDSQTRFIVEWAKQKRNEYDSVLNTDDDFVKEAYSNFSNVQLKKAISYYDQVILDCQKLSGDAIKSRKPRKRKVKTPEQLVAKITYLEEFGELNIKSVQPVDIVGAIQLWVYNVKTRKIGVYHADDAGGLSVKSSSILNYNQSKSVQKKLRKPEDSVPQVLSGGKVFLRNFIESVRAVESNLTGRINRDTILLKCVK